MHKVIVLEGLPASGKTILANYLRNNYGFCKINESLGKLAGINLTTDQKTIFNETIKKYALAKKSRKNTIIDRGYPSMLAWDYCAEKLNRTCDLKEKKRWVKKALEDGELFEPDLYVYLTISPDDSLLRRPRKETKIDVWTGKAGMRYCLKFYDDFFENNANKKRILILDGNLKNEYLANIILNKINQLR